MFLFLAIIIAAVLVIGTILGVDFKVLVAICLLILAVCFLPAVAGVIGSLFPGTVFAGIVGAGSYWIAGLLFFAAWLVDDETVRGVIEEGGELIGEVADTAVDVGTGIIGSLLSSPVGIGLIAVGAIWLLGSGSKRSSQPVLIDYNNRSRNNGGYNRSSSKFSA